MAAPRGAAPHPGGPLLTGADVVIAMLPNGDIVKRCYADVLAAAEPGALFVDSSTISINDAREVHALAESHGPNSTRPSPAESRARWPARWR